MSESLPMTIPTEPIGSIPRPHRLIEAIAANNNGADPALEAFYEEAIEDTIRRLEETGSPVDTDGEQRKYHNFWTYCVHGLPNTAPDGFPIPFAAGHVRRMLRLTAAPLCDDTSTSRETAFEKIRVRVAETALAAKKIGSD